MRTGKPRRYTPETKAAAIGSALAIGPDKASKQLAIPRRTLANWLAAPRAMPLKPASREELSRRLYIAFEEAIAVVRAGLHDPAQRLSDKVQATDVLGRHAALLSGGVTARTGSEVTVPSFLAGMTQAQAWQLRELLLEEAAQRDGTVHEHHPVPPELRDVPLPGLGMGGQSPVVVIEPSQAEQVAHHPQVAVIPPDGPTQRRVLSAEEMAELQVWALTPEGIDRTTPEERERIARGDLSGRPSETQRREWRESQVHPLKINDRIVNVDEVGTVPAFEDEELRRV